MSLPIHLALRDVLIISATAALWWLDRSTGGSSILLGILTGVATAYVGFLAHEYGHLAASLATKSTVSYPASIFSSLLFHFDSAKNDRRQFFAMSFGGYGATLVAVAFIALLCPLDAWSGRIALGLAGLGTIVTFVLEVPITVRVWRGGALPQGLAYRPHQS